PIVRGREVSRRLGDIVREVEELAGDGVTEITLLGQNVNSYGRDLGAGQYSPRFAALLRAVDAVDGIDRIRYTSPHPKDLRPETIAAMVECAAVCEHLHLPLQAGSDRTLARMHRGYTAERYLQKLAAARDAIPDLAVTTDLIVGFPDETEDDFRRTLEVVDEAAYDAAYTFVFSPRAGTPAAEMTEERVPPEVAQDRMRRLVEVVERHALSRHDARVGRVEEVLVDGPSKKDPAVMSGRTRQNKLVHFPSGVGSDAIRPGALVDVRVTHAAPHWLRGEPVRVVAPARTRRTRLRLAVAEPRPGPSHGSGPRHRGRRRSRGARRTPPPKSRSSHWTRGRCTAASTSPQPSRHPPNARPSPTTLSTWSIPPRSGRRCVIRPRPGPPSPTSKGAASAPSSSGGPACTCKPSSTPSASLARTPTYGPSSRHGRTSPEVSPPRTTSFDDATPTRRRRSTRTMLVASCARSRGSASPASRSPRSGRGSTSSARRRSRCGWSASGCRATRSTLASRRGSRRCARPASSRRSSGCSTGRRSPARPARPS